MPFIIKRRLRAATLCQYFIVVAFALLLLGALSVRLMTYDRYLPFVDYTDEATYIGWAQHLRGISDESALIATYGRVPPAYVWFNIGVQSAFDAVKSYPYNLQADYYPLLRLAAVVMGVLTTVTIASLAWQIADWRAGLLAGIVWAFAPIIVNYNSLAIPDPPVYLFTSLALLTGIVALKRESPLWLFASLMSGIIIIYLKFWIITALLPFLIVAALLFMRDRKKMLPWMIVYAMLAATTGGYFVIGVDPLNATNKLGAFTSAELLGRALDTSRLLNNWQKLLLPLGEPFAIITLSLGLIAGVLNARQDRRIAHLGGFGILLIYFVLSMPLAASISNVTADGRMRHIFPTAISLYILWAVAIVQIIWYLEARLTGSLMRRLTPIALGLAVLPLAPGYVRDDLQLIQDYNRVHVVEALRGWADDNLRADGLVMHSGPGDLDRVWNRLWGAYRGDNPFVWWTEGAARIIETPPEDYIERNILYFIIDEESLQEMPAAQEAEFRAYLENLLLLKTFDVDENDWAGTTTYFYSFVQPENQLNLQFGDQIRLSGYDLSAMTVKPGDSITFRPYWQALGQPQANYSLFMHLHTPDDRAPLSQVDSALSTLKRPTSAWDDGQELYLGRPNNLAIPADLPPGDYVLSVGVYDFQTGIRLQTVEGDAFQLAVTVS